MEKDDLLEKIREAIDKHCGNADVDHIADLAINAIWDDIEEYILEHETEECLFDD